MVRPGWEPGGTPGHVPSKSTLSHGGRGPSSQHRLGWEMGVPIEPACVNRHQGLGACRWVSGVCGWGTLQADSPLIRSFFTSFQISKEGPFPSIQHFVVITEDNFTTRFTSDGFQEMGIKLLLEDRAPKSS